MARRQIIAQKWCHVRVVCDSSLFGCGVQKNRSVAGCSCCCGGVQEHCFIAGGPTQLWRAWLHQGRGVGRIADRAWSHRGVGGHSSCVGAWRVGAPRGVRKVRSYHADDALFGALPQRSGACPPLHEWRLVPPMLNRRRIRCPQPCAEMVLGRSRTELGNRERHRPCPGAPPTRKLRAPHAQAHEVVVPIAALAPFKHLSYRCPVNTSRSHDHLINLVNKWRFMRATCNFRRRDCPRHIAANDVFIGLVDMRLERRLFDQKGLSCGCTYQGRHIRFVARVALPCPPQRISRYGGFS